MNKEKDQRIYLKDILERIQRLNAENSSDDILTDGQAL
jgi:uncharacterized protein with HEPN domain